MAIPRLTRNELVEHIKEIMPDDYNEYERLAFIEKEVAKQISFDEKYLWGDIGTKEKIYQLAKKEAQKPHQEIKRKIICVNMAELFGYVAKQFGYDVKYQKRPIGKGIKSGDNRIFNTISSQKQEHVCTVVGLSDGKHIEVDIQDDLSRLQTNSRPRSFGRNAHGTRFENGVNINLLERDKVDKLFRKIYNLDSDERFTDEYIMVFSAMLKCQNKTSIQMLEFFMDDPKIQKVLQNARCVEANKLYKAILKVCYDFSDEKQFFKGENKAIIEECILSDNKGNKRYSFCIYAEDVEQQTFYAYSKKSRRMVKLSKEEIRQMAQRDMKVTLRGRPSELKMKMTSFLRNAQKSPITLTGKSDTISIEDIFLDDDEEELE